MNQTLIIMIRKKPVIQMLLFSLSAFACRFIKGGCLKLKSGLLPDKGWGPGQ